MLKSNPSVKTLIAAFPTVDPEELKKLREMMATAGTGLEVNAALERANVLLEGHGIEAMRDNEWDNHYYMDIGAEYVNMGDPYIDTIVYDTRTDKFYCCGWGDYIESPSKKRRFAER